MKSKTLKAGLLVVLASTSLITSVVNAEDGSNTSTEQKRMKSDHGQDRKLKSMLHNLDLTDSQKAQVKSLVEASKAAKKDSRSSDADRQAMKEQIYTLISAPTFDAAKAKQLIASKQDKREEGVVNMLRLQNEVYQVLTPEQKVKFKENFDKPHKMNKVPHQPTR
ncbi:Spy/CpxP family protein refolding chaperone [Shewanella surugensis]|uniref:Spy/CpxP family protein refolding chaperone n=1 Tax=Shewanella surugensis TaxID=212020 RepID=A0ABT0LDZ6_9GAMM|nr:Spy/CpxP family protein refolding chaperone [Shewanella surugensis]MCL1125929.1 Spy/CpxP family protein refolding chaperone [Shewanella surugensis]